MDFFTGFNGHTLLDILLFLICIICLKERFDSKRRYTQDKTKIETLSKQVTELQSLVELHHNRIQEQAEDTSHCDDSDFAQRMRDVLHGAKVLLVEDNDINREITKEFLRSHDIVVDEAIDGEEAVAATQKNKYDLVLMDIQMPNLDGLSATRAIRNSENEKKTPIVALTSCSQEEDRLKSFNAGMNDHLTKPVNSKILKKALLRWIADLDLGENQSYPHSDTDTQEILELTKLKEAIAQNLQPIKTQKIPTVHIKDSTVDKVPTEQQIRKEQAMQTATLTDQSKTSLTGVDKQIVDKAAGLVNVGGNETLYTRLITRFVDNYTETVTNIRAAINENDRELAIRLAHTIKGVAASLGANKLTTSSKNLEFTLREDRETENDIQQTDDDLKITIMAFNQLLGIPTTPVEEKVKETTQPKDNDGNFCDRMRKELEEIPRLMESDFIKAGDKLQEIIPQLEKIIAKEKVYALNAAYSDVDFESVENLSKELIQLLPLEC